MKKGYKFSNEIRLKMSLAKKGKMPKNFFDMQRKGQETRKGRPSAMRGKKHSVESKIKMRFAKLGKPRAGDPKNWIPSKESKEKNRLAHIGKHHSPSTEFKKGSQSGEKHNQWKGGVSKKSGYKTYMETLRRCRIKNNGGTFLLEEWNDLKKKYDFMCLMCERFEPYIKLSPDHIVPVSRNGRNEILNLQPLCLKCNAKKNDKICDYRFNVLIKQL